MPVRKLARSKVMVKNLETAKTCASCKHEEKTFSEYPCHDCQADNSCWIAKGEVKEVAEKEREFKGDPKSTYYDAGGYGVIEVIKAKLTPEQFKGFLLGNCIKYSLRANWKDQFDRDVEKISYYSGWLKDED